MGIRSLLWWARSHSFIDLNHEIESTIFLIGSGRSGTTWIQEVLCRTASLRPVFEPFNPNKNPEFFDLEFGRYIAPGRVLPELHEKIEHVLRGRYRSPWSDRMNAISRPRVYRNGRVVKEIRSLLWAGWLRNEFPDVRIIHLLRHPLSNVASGLSLGWNADRLGGVLEQAELVDRHFGDIAGELRHLEDPWQKYTAVWAIENLVALREVGTTATLAIYDDLAAQHEGFAPLLAIVQNGANADSPIDPGRPSRMSRSSGSGRGREHTSVARLPAERIESAYDVLRMFNLDKYFRRDGRVDTVRLRRAWEAGRL